MKREPDVHQRQTLFLDDHWSFNFRNDPKRFGFVLARYKFCAQMAPDAACILELGCGSGVGVPILSSKAKKYLGVDSDLQAVSSAKRNFTNAKATFVYDDFMEKVFGKFDLIVSLDVIEHIFPQYEDVFFDTVLNNLNQDGICVIGTPNIIASSYASECSKMGHVNMFSQEKLTGSLKRRFHQTFSFGMNDEIVHTGFAPMVHYLICLACHRK